VAAPGVAIAVDQGRKIERLLDNLGDEASQVLLGKPLTEVEGHQKILLGIVGVEDRRTLLGGSRAPREWIPGFTYVGPPGRRTSSSGGRETSS
jgi:hypothetical protein